MKFGTLQKLTREPEQTSADSQEFDTDFDFDSLEGETDGEADLDGFDFDDVEDEEGLEGEGGNPVIDKLLALKSEIDGILADMGYAGDDEFADADFDTDPEFDDEFDTEFGDEPAGEFDDQMDPTGLKDEAGGTGDLEAGDEFGDEEEFGDEPAGDPDFEGDIRTVTGANLVYKRKQEDGNFEELWIYNVGNDIKKETTIRRAILAGTDIVPSQRESEDGTQHAETTTLGNVQYLKISGLPN